MKNSHKLILLVLLSVLSILSGCRIQSSGYEKNEEINESVRKKLQTKLDDFLTFFTQKNARSIKSILSKKISNEANGFIDSILNIDILNKSSKVDIIDEFYVKNIPGTGSNMVSSEIEGHKYNFYFAVEGLTSYIYLISIKNKGYDGELMLSIVFNEENSDYKIQYIHFSPYKYNGNIGPYYSNLSNKLYNEGNISAAYFYTIFATLLSQPSRNSFHYVEEPTMRDIYNKVVTDFNSQYPMPIVVKELDTKPKIINIGPEINHSLLVNPICVLDYESRVVNSIDEISSEATNLNKILPKIFPGLDVVSDTIVYNVDYLNNDRNETVTLRKNTIN